MYLSCCFYPCISPKFNEKYLIINLERLELLFVVEIIESKIYYKF